LLRLVLLTIALVLAALLIFPAVLLYTGVQQEALVQSAAAARPQDVDRIQTLLRQHDPRDLRDGETRTLTVSERDLNLGLRSVLPLAQWQRSQLALDRGLGRVNYSLKLPANPLGNYFNLSVSVKEDAGELTLDQVQVGELNLPGWSLAPLVLFADNTLKRRFVEYRGAREALQAVSLQPGEMSVTYRWDRQLAKQLEQRGREVLLPAADRERALAYYRVLADTSRTVGARASLDQLLKPLFASASRRSADGDAAAENRALFLVLGTVLNRSSVYRLVGGNAADLEPGHRYVQWTLHGRGDLAQHFGISAAITAAGGGVLADSIGVFKELDDSRGGTGFSFADLLADRAGVELASAAVGRDAQRIQTAMSAKALRESDFMPAINGLPEGLMEMEFKQRYRDLDDARYAQVKGELETRIARLPIYR
jgi:uncharacterized protein YfiM (DUF2279 family)